MFVTLLDQLYILLTCGITGAFVLRRLQTGNNTDAPVAGTALRPGSCIMCGLTVLTAYAGYFSLFAGVGYTANIIMVTACIVFIIIDRRAYLEDISFFIHKSDMKFNLIKLFLSALIILICTYFTASGKFAYDTGTYHAQSIHWIESYGVVKGLAYMQTRLGFNSSYFCLCALYSLHFMGQSLHSLSGFLASMVMVYSLNGFTDHIVSLRNTNPGETFRLRVSDFLYIVPFFYFVITAVEIISPATDFGVIWLIIWLCIRWVELIEADNEKKDPHVKKGYILLCVMSVFLVSVKLSVGVLALLTLKPAYELIKERKWVETARYVFAGIVLIGPYFIRNYYITGWLVYPFPAVDLFSPDWKIPLEGVKYEADEVVVWARYTKDVALVGQSIREWFPVWWREQGIENRCMSVSAFAGAALILARTVITAVLVFYLRVKKRDSVHARPERLSDHQGDYIYFGLILLACFAFFIISAPSNRFGYAYILMLPLFSAGDCIVNVVPFFTDDRRKTALSFIPAFFVCAGLIKGICMCATYDWYYIRENNIGEYVFNQKDYPAANSSKKQWEGMMIYYPVTEGDQIWYSDFPAILYEGNLDGIERRGTDIKDGFRQRM